MTKIAIICSSLLLGSASFSAEVVLTLDVPNKKDIYNNFVTKTGLHKKGEDRYHVTVHWIKNVGAQDKDSLTKYMKTSLANYNNPKVQFALKKADRYLVGGRTPNKSPIVMFPDDATKARLLEINKAVDNDLKKFKSPSGKVYTAFGDVKPGTYNPHFTLANTSHIEKEKVNRDDAIKLINKKVDAYNAKNPGFTIELR